MKFLLTYFSSFSGLLCNNPIHQARWLLLFQFSGCWEFPSPAAVFYRRLFTHYSHCQLVEETTLLTAVTWQEINVCANLHMCMHLSTHATKLSLKKEEFMEFITLWWFAVMLCISRTSCSRSRRMLHFKTRGSLPSCRIDDLREKRKISLTLISQEDVFKQLSSKMN